MSPEFFSGWGIRTVAEGEARYNPMSYHNGSVWPHDNALIGLGLASYGLADEAARLFAGMFAAAAYVDLRRLPEVFCGFRRGRASGPTSYPVACAPQAWAAAAPFALLQACLRVEIDAAAREVRLNRPRLPPGLNQVAIRSLRVDDAEIDLLLRRHDHDVATNVTRQEGDVRVVVVL
jgi:glycogen debranching enzyme